MFTSAEMIVGLWHFPVLLCIVTPLTMLAIWSVNQAVKNISKYILQHEGGAEVGFQAHSAS